AAGDAPRRRPRRRDASGPTAVRVQRGRRERLRQRAVVRDPVAGPGHRRAGRPGARSPHPGVPMMPRRLLALALAGLATAFSACGSTNDEALRASLAAL